MTIKRDYRKLIELMLQLRMFPNVCILFLHMTMVVTAPLQFPLLQLQGTMQQQQLALQEQMLALQQFQALQRYNAMPSSLSMGPPQPLLILLPDTQPSTEQDDRFSKLYENSLKSKPFQDLNSEEINNEDLDSITIEADPQNDVDKKNIPMKAILLVPNSARFSIGGIISAIPFLPFEVNVPDSISWIYNGISGIISGIGQSWPFRPNDDNQRFNMKSALKELQTSKKMPIVVIPLGQPMLPMQL